MEFIFFVAFGGVVIGIAALLLGRRGSKPSEHRRRTARDIPQRRRNAPSANEEPQAAATHALSGSAYVVDGDGLIILKTQIRLFGIDAPELNHPYGKNAKWALVSLCKGQTIRAEVTAQDVHGRTVARCYLPDGRDLSAEMVKLGMAIDWPKFSDGIYRDLEPTGIRKKLWLADARQKGRMHVWEQYDAKQKAGRSQA